MKGEWAQLENKDAVQVRDSWFCREPKKVSRDIETWPVGNKKIWRS